jgi:hypothetical protein
MTHEELIAWSLENNISGFITRYRLLILDLINGEIEKAKKEGSSRDQKKEVGKRL